MKGRDKPSSLSVRHSRQTSVCGRVGEVAVGDVTGPNARSVESEPSDTSDGQNKRDNQTADDNLSRDVSDHDFCPSTIQPTSELTLGVRRSSISEWAHPASKSESLFRRLVSCW